MVKSLYYIFRDPSLVSNPQMHVMQLTTTFDCSSKKWDAFGLGASCAWTHTRTHTYKELENKKKDIKKLGFDTKSNSCLFQHKWSSTREIITDTGM